VSYLNDRTLPQVITVEVKIDKGVLMKAMLDDSKSEYSRPSWHLASARYTHDYVGDHRSVGQGVAAMAGRVTLRTPRVRWPWLAGSGYAAANSFIMVTE
jgi:hypothetical protein